MPKDNQPPYEDGIPEELLWDAQNQQFMQRSLFPGQWIPARISPWDVDKPEYRYDPKRDRTYQEVVLEQSVPEPAPVPKRQVTRRPDYRTPFDNPDNGLATAVPDKTRTETTADPIRFEPSPPVARTPAQIGKRLSDTAGNIINPGTIPVSSAIDYAREQITLPRWMREAGFFLRHPRTAINIGYYDPNSRNISTRAGAIAADQNILSKKDGEERNAMRHGLWQGAITSRYGEPIAREVGNAHEANPYADLTQQRVPTLEEADELVDLLNNRIGRAVGTRLPEAGMQRIAFDVLEEFYRNGLYTARPDSAGGYTIQKTKLPEEKYRKMVDAIAKRDTNGYFSSDPRDLKYNE